MTTTNKPLSKGDFAKHIAQECGIESIKEAEKIINCFTQGVSSALAKGEKIALVGFGNFEVRERAERQGRNPKTGETMTIKASKVPSFKPGKGLKEKVNP